MGQKGFLTGKMAFININCFQQSFRRYRIDLITCEMFAEKPGEA